MTLAAPAPSTARPVRRPWRRWLGWLLLIALVVGGALLAMRVTSAVSEPFRGALDPESAGEHGSLALAEILRDQGIEVQVVRNRDAARAAISDDTTLVMTDPYALSDDAVAALIEPSNRTVLLSTSARVLRLLDLGEDAFASVNEQVTASCDLPELARVGTISPERLFTPADGVTGCFGDDAGAALLVDDRDGVRIAMIDAARLFSNASLAENGNAALALALLGQTGHVVWYVPSFLDSDIESQGEPTIGDLTPGWVTPAILMLAAALIAAGIWRGRRFGPLVAETLPVTVRASETMHGRARLTAKTADAAHAAEAIREGTAKRVARRLGLHDRATSTEVADAVADRLRVPRPGVIELLAGHAPVDDDALVDVARRLSDLEAAVEATIRAERGSP